MVNLKVADILSIRRQHNSDHIALKVLAEQHGVNEQVLIEEALGPKKPKSAYMHFCDGNRMAVQEELGNGSVAEVARAMSEKWKAVNESDREKYDKLAEADKKRYENQNAKYLTWFQDLQAAESAEKKDEVEGPSRVRLTEEEKNERWKPREKKEVKKREMTADEKLLDQQNKDLDKEVSAQSYDRIRWLLKQSEVFAHFMKDSIPQELLDEVNDKKKRARAKIQQSPSKRRMTEKEGDAAELAAQDEDNDVVRLTKQPSFIQNGQMRAYQIEGLNWLANNYNNGINCILADEMGLGKTLQSISLLAWLKEAKKITGPHLIVSPKSTLSNWQRELKKWLPSARSLLFHGNKTERADLIAGDMAVDQFDVVVTSYEMLIIEKTAFKKFGWRYIVVDEAHRMKNEQSKLSEVMRTLKSHSRLLITGTPLQNNLHELWALLNFLLPDVFSSSNDFDEWFSLDNKEVEHELMTQLHKVLRPFLIRRLKTDVEHSIPPKTELLLFTGLSAVQKSTYKACLMRDVDALMGQTGSNNASKSRLQNILMQLRKCCNHPYLFDGVEDKSLDPFGEHLATNSGKMVVLDKLLLRLKERGHRVLLFCQMTRMLDIMEDYCEMRQFKYCRIDGNTSGADREASMDVFNQEDSEKFMFLLSTRAGGLGINLQTADTVILYDSDWNPQVDLQAQDRAHRIGQKKPVMVYRFVCQSTVEEKIIDKAMLKLQMDAAVIQSGRLAESSENLSKDEALEMVRYGADQIFKSQDSSITDEDIEALLQRGKAATDSRNEKLKETAKKSLLNFSLDGRQALGGGEFGNDEWSSKELTDAKFAKELTEAIGKRDRKQITPMDISHPPSRPMEHVPKGIKLPPMPEWQFFNTVRISELYMKMNKNMQDTKHASQELLAEMGLVEGLTEEEHKEREQLLAHGLINWSKVDFKHFVQSCERYGRDRLEDICKDVEGKNEEEVRRYAAIFWEKGPCALSEWSKILEKIEASESRLSKDKGKFDTIAEKVKQYNNPWQELTLNYSGSNRGKLYQENEDRFLLCMTHKLGWNRWDQLKKQIRKCPDFRFDWIFKSRTAVELARRVNSLVTVIENEAAEKKPAKKKRLDNGESKANTSEVEPLAKKSKLDESEPQPTEV